MGFIRVHGFQKILQPATIVISVQPLRDKLVDLVNWESVEQIQAEELWRTDERQPE